MAKTAFIIGGTGQIGFAAARRLARDGWAVTAAHRGERALPDELAALGVTERLIDREDDAALLAAASGSDLVVDTVAYTPAHGEQLLRLGHEIGSLVVISTGSVLIGANGGYLDIATGPDDFPTFPDPMTEDSPMVDNEQQTYSPLKATIERLLTTAPELPISILRPGAIHGEHSPMLREWWFIKRVLDGRGRIPLAYGGESLFSTSATVNIAELIALCAETPGHRVLNAVDDDQLTVAGIGGAVLAELGSSAELAPIPGPPHGRVGDTPWSVTHPIRLLPDAAKRELGYEPVASYAEAVGPAIRSAVDRLRAAERRGDGWREAFPIMVARYGADEWFDYDAEDAWFESNG